jgi:two-component system, NarL family, nitrate/nitrite response regulator NarL
MPISVAFFDDHPILLDGLSRIFRSDAEFDVVATGVCAADVVEVARKFSPDVLVVDLSMPGNVLEAMQAVTRISPNSKLIAFTASAGVDSAVRTLESGATGYVLKGSSADELVGAIRSVLAGETFVTPSFATKVIAALRQAAIRNTVSRAIKFSVREDQIIRLLQRGWTNKEIALQLRISEKTVKHYMTLLMQKLNVRNRLEVIIAARDMSAETADASAAMHSRH